VECNFGPNFWCQPPVGAMPFYKSCDLPTWASVIENYLNGESKGSLNLRLENEIVDILTVTNDNTDEMQTESMIDVEGSGQDMKKLSNEESNDSSIEVT
jgi:hypothetical protein